MKELDPSYSLDAEAEEQVLQLADDFLDRVCKQSLRLAQHRGSKTLDVQDVQLVLAKQWNIVLPGLGAPTFNNIAPKKLMSRATSGPLPSVALGGGGGTSKGGGAGGGGLKRRLSGGDPAGGAGGGSSASGGGGPPTKTMKTSTGSATATA